MTQRINIFKFALSIGSLGYYLAYLGQLIYFLDLRQKQDKAFMDPYNQYLTEHIGQGCIIDESVESRVACTPAAQSQGRTLIDRATKHAESTILSVDTRLNAALTGAVLGTSFAFFMNGMTPDREQEDQSLRVQAIIN